MDDKPKLKVLEFPNSSLADIPEKLRNIAELIEDGYFGDAKNCIVVLETDCLFEVFGLGCEADGTTAHYLLACAQRKIEAPFLALKGHTPDD